MEFTPLSNQLLVAMPAMRDPNFERTVSLLCQHDENGSLGVVINRRIEDFSLADVLEHLEIPPGEVAPGRPVFSGGPVHPELGMVLHDYAGDWQSTLRVGEHLGLTTSLDIMQAMSRGEVPGRSLMVLGYAGWGSGQLEHELQENAWLCAPADPQVIFETPVEERWSRAAGQLGIDLLTISPDAGHA
ncbi:MAG: YqgE/AlgH family protein [Proteobacteria bacterium]|nr:MAG: YqgE/AlgH family protein [Pseudomonadota bacterium]